MMKIKQKQRYYYMLALKTEWYPRKIAGELVDRWSMGAYLVSVTDLQNNQHSYGRTWRVGVPFDRQVKAAKKTNTQAPSVRLDWLHVLHAAIDDTVTKFARAFL